MNFLEEPKNLDGLVIRLNIEAMFHQSWYLSTILHNEGSGSCVEMMVKIAVMEEPLRFIKDWNIIPIPVHWILNPIDLT